MIQKRRQALNRAHAQSYQEGCLEPEHAGTPTPDEQLWELTALRARPRGVTGRFYASSTGG